MPLPERLSHEDRANNRWLYDDFWRHNEPDGWSVKSKVGNAFRLISIEHRTGILIAESSILDVGCGSGVLLQVLDSTTGVKEYTGIDLYPRAIRAARHTMPHGRFIQMDFLAFPFSEKFDYVFCSGALSTKFDTDNYLVMEAFLRKMWALSRVGMAFNFLTDENEKDPFNEIFMYNVARVLELCRSIDPTAQLDSQKAKLNEKSKQAEVFMYRPDAAA